MRGSPFISVSAHLRVLYQNITRSILNFTCWIESFWIMVRGSNKDIVSLRKAQNRSFNYPPSSSFFMVSSEGAISGIWWNLKVLCHYMRHGQNTKDAVVLNANSETTHCDIIFWVGNTIKYIFYLFQRDPWWPSDYNAWLPSARSQVRMSIRSPSGLAWSLYKCAALWRSFCSGKCPWNYSWREGNFFPLQSFYLFAIWPKLLKET